MTGPGRRAPVGDYPAAMDDPAPSTLRARLLRDAVDYFAAEGVGNLSFRQMAAALGTSHRMLTYHFGSREGLLTAVVEVLEQNERDLLERMLAEPEVDGRILAWRYWTHVADAAGLYGSLFFELASHAMRADEIDAPLRSGNHRMWVDALARMWSREQLLGPAAARRQARLNLAVARGLVHDLLLTGDREGVDQAMARFDLLSFGTAHPLGRVRRLAGPVEPATTR